MLPVALVAANAAKQAAGSSGGKKGIIIGVIVAGAAIPFLIFLLIISVVAGMTPMGGLAAVASNAMQDRASKCTAPVDYAADFTGDEEYREGNGPMFMAKYLYDKGLRGEALRYMWTLGMRESSGMPITSRSSNFNGADYGPWQLNYTAHHEGVANRLNLTMDEVGASWDGSLEYVLYMTNGFRNFLAWGINDQLQWDWSKYSIDWQRQYRSKVEENTLRYYNQFPSAMEKAGLPDWNTPLVGGYYYVGERPRGQTFWQRGARPPLQQGAPIVDEGYDAGYPMVVTTSDNGDGVIPTSTVNIEPPRIAGQRTISGHEALLPGDPRLQMFRGGGVNWTVAGEWVPVFRSFLDAWEAHPELGGGRLSLQEATKGGVYYNGHYNWRYARAAAGKISDHAGYAVDLRVDIMKPPDGNGCCRYLTNTERLAVEDLLRQHPSLRWGGHYRTINDEMHFYIAPGQTTENGYVIPARGINAIDVYGDERFNECNRDVFASGIGLNEELPIQTGSFTTRENYFIPEADYRISVARSFTEPENMPCPNLCIEQCDRLAARIHGYYRSGYESARTHWFDMVEKGYARPGDKSIPKGALVYWDTGEHGHVATYVGNGWVVHNWSNPSAGVHLMPIEEVDRSLGGKYYGWSLPIFSNGIGRMSGVKPPIDVARVMGIEG